MAGRVIGWDVETHVITPGNPTPPLVCLTWYDGKDTGIVLRDEAIRIFKDWLQSDATLVAHNFVFDTHVMLNEAPELIQLVFDKLDRRGFSDTMLRERVLDNIRGKLRSHNKRRGYYTLANLMKLHFNEHMEKEDTWRLRYKELDGVPLSEWPQEAIDYAIGDSVGAWRVWYEQLDGQFPNEVLHSASAFALEACSIEGLRTDKPYVNALKHSLEREYKKLTQIAFERGLIRYEEKKDKYVRNMSIIKELVETSIPNVPRTAKDNIVTKREVLLMSDDPGLLALAERSGTEKLLKTYVPVLKQGTKTRINPKYQAILETFRTSCRNPNVQNLPRKGGVRDCFVPRDGFVYCFCDYNSLEMRSLAQAIHVLPLGNPEARLAEVLKTGKDPHVITAAVLMGVSYDEAIARYERGDPEVDFYRQLSKIANFGYPGGMGAQTFVEYAAGYGVKITLEQAQDAKEAFMGAYPEMSYYFKYCSSLAGGGRATLITFPITGMQRGDVPYTAICNGYFQHLAAVGAKHATYEVVRECYTGDTELRGCKPVLFLHDEIGIEIPRTHDTDAAARRLQRVMIDTMANWINVVPVLCEPVLMPRWYKGAKPTYVDGKLVPCVPQKTEDGKTVWVPEPSSSPLLKVQHGAN